MEKTLYTSLCLIIFAVLMTGCKQESNSTDIAASVVTISLVSDQEAFLNGESVALDEVGSRLQALAQEANTYVVYDFEPEAPMSGVQDIMRQVTDAGVAGVRFADELNDSQLVRFYRPAITAR